MEKKGIVFKGQDGQVITTSLKVAEVFGKRHNDVLKSIRNLRTAQNCAVLKMFETSSYANEQGKEQPMFIMNRDGFTLLAMSFNGKKALDFKIAYINAFNDMEEKLRVRQIEEHDAKTLKEAQEVKNIAEAGITIIEASRRLLNLSEPAVAGLLNNLSKRCGLDTEISYVYDKNGVTHALRDLLPKNGIKLSARAFNKIAVAKGYGKYMSRTGHGGKVYNWFVISDKGNDFGRNDTDPDHPSQTQARWYDDKFPLLLERLGISKEPTLAM